MTCPFCGKEWFEYQTLYYDNGKEEPAGFCKCPHCGNGGLFCPNARGMTGTIGTVGAGYDDWEEVRKLNEEYNK